MDSKDDAMSNFRRVINAKQQQKEQEDKQKEIEAKEKETEEQIQESNEENQSAILTKNTIPNDNSEEEENKPTEEERQQEALDDSIRYDISGDREDEEEESEENNAGNINLNYGNNNDTDSDVSNDDKDDSNVESNDSDNTADIDPNEDKHNKIDDDSKKSKKSASTQDKSTSEGGGKKGVENDTQTPERYRANNTATQGDAGMSSADAAEKGAEAGAKAGTVAEKGAEAGAAAEKGSKIATFLKGIALWKVILITVLVIIILVILIGYVSFFINGAGIVREQVLKFADGIWTNVKGFFVGQDEAGVKDENIGNVAIYLENMGYDLANYGFLSNEDGMPFDTSDLHRQDGTGVIKNNDGKIVYEKIIDDETGELKVKTIKSKYLKSYLAAENNTYMVANDNPNIWDIFKSEDDIEYGTGMIHLENISVNSAKDFVEIDRENKKMNITYKNYVYQYDLDGWTGRYGKSIEFLLTMHLATMAPDFVYSIVKDKDFDTKVSIALYPIEASVRLKMPNPNNEDDLLDVEEHWYTLKSAYGLTDDVLEAVREYNQDNVNTFTPIITKVKNHWYKDLDFTGCYNTAKNLEGTEDDEAFTSRYEYVGLGLDNDVLSKIDNLYVEEIRKKDIFQTKEPAVKKNTKIKEMLLGQESGKGNDKGAQININEDYKYYIYSGSAIPKEGLQKQYIIKQADLESSIDGETEKVKNTRTFTYAFAILEAVHSEDAEYILRDLKELFQDIGLNIDDGNIGAGIEEDVTPLKWPIDGYKPIVWDPQYDGETSKVNISHETETTMGFEQGLSFVMPAGGEIIEITRNETDDEEATVGDSIKIKFNNSNPDVEDMYMYITGLKLDENITEKTVKSEGERIGETTNSDIIIVMTDNKKQAIYNVDAYIVPEAWQELELVEEISDSEFGGNVLGGYGDFSPYTGTFSEEFYWYLAVALEGMPVTRDEYFTRSNGGVSWLSGESYITVGPGLYMHSGNCNRFRTNGYTNFNQYDLNSVFPKDVTDRVFKQSIAEEYKIAIDNYMSGYELTQKQYEALVFTAYQRGIGNGSTLYTVLDAIKQGKTGKELMNIWTYSTSEFAGVSKRRYAEWYLYTYGVYLPPYGNQSKAITFNSSTPYTDAMNGINSVDYY